MNWKLSLATAGLVLTGLVACEKAAPPEPKAPPPPPPAKPAPEPPKEVEVPVAADFRAEAEKALPAEADLNAALDALEKEIDAAE